MPFKEILINDKAYQIVTPNKIFEPKYRERLSKILLEKYGKNILAEDTIKALIESYDFFTDEFSKVINGVKDMMFYFFVFNLHEQTAELSYLRSVDKIHIPVEQTYFAQYRRILKLILQQSCSVSISENIQPNAKWMANTLNILEELIFLGSFALDMVNTISEQKLTGGSVMITFNDDLYVFGNPPEWKGFFGLFHDNFPEQIDGSILDETLQEKFDYVLKNEFNINLTELSLIIENVSERLYNQLPPRFCMLSELIDVFQEQSDNAFIENFILGLTLTKNNVAKLKSGIYSSYNGDRLIHRPFLSVIIEDTECILFGKYTFLEAVNTLFQNQITHGKLPLEWGEIPSIKKVQRQLIQYHKDILENPVEKALSDKGITFERNLKTLKAKNHYLNHSINDSPGEIDFIFILDSTIYIADCKNLTKRYEMHGYYQDLTKFKPYIEKMNEKLSFMNKNLDKLESHLKILTNNDILDINDFKIEGIFIVNTPTLYSVNAPFKVYSFYNFEILIEGEDVFDAVICLPDDQDTEIVWPYIDSYNQYLNERHK
jgi:hypothetical protein